MGQNRAACAAGTGGFRTRAARGGSPGPAAPLRPAGARAAPCQAETARRSPPAALTCSCLRSRGLRPRAPARRRAASTAMVAERSGDVKGTGRRGWRAPRRAPPPPRAWPGARGPPSTNSSLGPRGPRLLTGSQRRAGRPVPSPLAPPASPARRNLQAPRSLRCQLGTQQTLTTLLVSEYTTL